MSGILVSRGQWRPPVGNLEGSGLMSFSGSMGPLRAGRNLLGTGGITFSSSAVIGDGSLTWNFIENWTDGNPTGWSDTVWVPSGSVGLSTVAASDTGGTHSGGPSNLLRQNYTDGWPDWLVRTIPGGALSDGDFIELDFWIKYHSSFDFSTNGSGGGTGDSSKQIIFKDDVGDQQIYWNITHSSLTPSIPIQVIEPSANWYEANVGGSYEFPLGTWVNLYLKLVQGSNNDGSILVKVDGTTRSDYTGISTVGSGNGITSYNLNTTGPGNGAGVPNNKRWWGTFKERVTRV